VTTPISSEKKKNLGQNVGGVNLGLNRVHLSGERHIYIFFFYRVQCQN